MTDISRCLADFAAGLHYEDLPTDVVQRTKLLILDTAGIMVRARNDAESTPAMVRAIERLGLATGDCAVPGDVKTYTPSAAALINGTLAHSLDFDDTHAEASLHASAPIVSAAMAAAEMSGASGKDFITAGVAGYEVQISLSWRSGHQIITTAATIRRRRAASSVPWRPPELLGMDADGIESGFGIALSQAAGSMQFLADGAWTKRSHVGQAAQNGLMCASWRRRLQGARNKRLKANGVSSMPMRPNADDGQGDAGLGTQWETMRLAVKPSQAAATPTRRWMPCKRL